MHAHNMLRRSGAHRLTTIFCALAVASGATHVNAGARGGDSSQACQLSIMLVNDDGYQAPGINTLFGSLQQAGHKVTMVAPLTQQSGRSSAINTGVGQAVSVVQKAPNIWAVDGTPADSVKAGLGIVFSGDAPDLVVSGANFGPNIGQQTVLNSGTLGASLTAKHANIPAIAVSVGMDVSERNATPAFKSTLDGFKVAAEKLDALIAALITKNGCQSILGGNHILSMNIPVPAQKIQGITYAPLSPNELFHLVWYKGTDNKHRITFHQAGKEVTHNNDDVGYFSRHYITLTPISGDLTGGSYRLDAPTKWLPDITHLH